MSEVAEQPLHALFSHGMLSGLTVALATRTAGLSYLAPANSTNHPPPTHPLAPLPQPRPTCRPPR